jgi:hypothetical protein
LIPQEPRFPRVDYQWVEGYWYPRNGRWFWHDGYRTRPPFPDSYWVEPYWDRGRYFEGYWDTPRGRYDHDHRWDRDRGRDWNREWREHSIHGAFQLDERVCVGADRSTQVRRQADDGLHLVRDGVVRASSRFVIGPPLTQRLAGGKNSKADPGT